MVLSGVSRQGVPEVLRALLKIIDQANIEETPVIERDWQPEV